MSLEIQKSFIGAILINPNAFYETEGVVSAKMLESRLETIYSRLAEWYSQGKEIDFPLFVKDLNSYTKENYTLSDLMEFRSYSKSQNAIEYATAIKNQFEKGLAQSYLENALIDLEEKTPLETFTSLESQYKELEKSEDSQNSHISASYVEAMDRIHNAKENKGLSGVDSGFADFNKLNGGFQATDQIILAARPGMGKTSLAANYILNAAKKNHPVLFFSLEMSKTQIFHLLCAIETGISTDKMRSGELNDCEVQRITKAMEDINELPIFIYDNVISLDQIILKSRLEKRKHGIQLMVLDYLQLVSSTKKNQPRHEMISEVSRRLKLLAGPGDCNWCNLVLSQLNRSVESRGDKRPMISDLRESGAIEQDADMIKMLYREGYYTGQESQTELLILKNRHGRVATLIRDFKNRKFIESTQRHY